jgi:hypothetical protein
MKLAIFSILVGLSSCVAVDPTTARAVQTKPGKGGIVTLNPPSDPRARTKADAIMKQTCASKTVEIAEEGEAVVGTSSSSSTAHKAADNHGIKVASLGFGSFGSSSPTSETDSVQKQVTEWRITYDCK